MKIAFLILILLICISFTFSKNRIICLEPDDGAEFVSTENNIIIRFDNNFYLTQGELNKSIKVTGSAGKTYTGKIQSILDCSEVVFNPDLPFQPGERITVSISGMLLKTFSNEKLFRYSFLTSIYKLEWDAMQSFENEFDGELSNPIFSSPPDLPVLTVGINNNPESGYIFLSNFRLGITSYTPYLIITDKNGIIYSYKELTSNGMDFKKQPNGNLTYFSVSKAKYYELGQNFNVLDSFYCGNGYKTDQHELIVLSNRHALLMSYDLQVVNMSLIVPGGDTAANVTGLIIQEIDENKNVVFQWRSWDHFLITDAWHENMLAHTIDAVHGNALEIDNDSNLMLSSRHLDEITKINRTTGDIIWRLGGKNNQFIFTNDTLKFTYQHAIRRISNGNITLYDNGNFHTPKFSRALEYSINEAGRTVTKVWEFRNSPTAIFGPAMGYAQRLPGGNTLISWGTTNPTVTEVTPTGTKAFQMTLPTNMFSYRVFKFDWNGPPTSGGQEISKVPSSYGLSQNYPNPFNPVTSISFDIPKAGFVSLLVFDITGREIKNLVSENKEAGSYTIRFNGTNISSGLYFYRLVTGNFNSTQKMILVK